MNKVESLISSVNSIHIFSSLDEESSELIHQTTKMVQADKKEVVVKRGDHLDGLYGVMAGKLKIYLLSCEGQERIIRIVMPGDSFGEAIMFSDIISPVYVEALSPCELMFIPKDSIFSLLR